MTVQVQIAGDIRPHEIDHRAVSVIRMDTGATGLDDRVAQGSELGQVELGLRIEPAGLDGAVGRKHAVRADDLTRAVVADQQVIAVPVEVIDVEAGCRRVQDSPQLLREDEVAEALRRADLVRCCRDED